MFRNTAVALALISLLPLDLGAQSTGNAAHRIDAAMQRAATAGIPVALLQNKINEGRAKGIPAERIAAAVERREAGLSRAQQAMSGVKNVNAADLAVGADALEAGISVAVLKTISETAPGERRAVAITALTELIEAGHVPDHALERVKEALARGPDALAALPAQAAAARERRGPPTGFGGGRPSGVGAQADGPGGPPSTVPAAGRGPVLGGGKPADVGRPGARP